MNSDRSHIGANKLLLYTILFMIAASAFGISSVTNDFVISLLISQFIVLFPAILFLLMPGPALSDRIGLGKVSMVPFVAAVFAGLSMIPLLSFVNSISMVFVKNMTDARIIEAAEKYPMPVLLLVAAIIPAVVEEVIFRGIYFTAYSKKGVIKAAILSAILFALMHGNLNQCAYAVVAGFLFAMINYAGGSLIYSVIMHMIINSFTVVSLYAEELGWSIISRLAEEKQYETVSEVIGDMLPEAIIGLVLCSLTYGVIRRFGSEKEMTISKDGRVLDGYLVAGIVILVINMVAAEIG